MNFLQLCVRLRQEVGAAGTGPSSVTGQIGENKRLVDWIATADEDIQRLRNEWLFMRAGFRVNTVTDQAAYAPTECTDTASGLLITRFRNWVKDSFRIHLAAAGVRSETELSFIGYDDWYRLYNFGAQPASFPSQFTILHNQSFSLGPRPNAVYVVSGEYQRAATTLVNNNDIPAYPSEYRMLPVYRAMMSYGRYSGAPEAYHDGHDRYRQLLGEMERTQLPELQFGGEVAC
ncbi:MAG: hypothetical protein DDT21_02605 [Syntrophomonadaceae bacterium]|nr:hypothetical protein [Bacillota bacterium]